MRWRNRRGSASAGGWESFPTLVQRRDYCGPSTVELVLRYWRGGPELSNDQIAESVKFPQSGTPVYRIREFPPGRVRYSAPAGSGGQLRS